MLIIARLIRRTKGRIIKSTGKGKTTKLVALRGYIERCSVARSLLNVDGAIIGLLFCLGHAHVTDFNIATVLEDGESATSMSGTKPYIGMN